MSNPERTYRLVVFDAPDDPEAARDVVVRATGMHAADAMRWVARTPGVFPRFITEAQVRPILDGFYDLGVAAEAWRSDSFPDFSKPRTIHEAACLPEGLRTRGLHGEPTHWIPWNLIEVVSAGRVTADDEFRGVEPPRWTSALAMGIKMLVRRQRLPPRTRRANRILRDPIGEVYIVRREPRLVLRLAADQMNYASLGPRLRHSSAENFPILLSAIVAQANEAWVTQPTHTLLELSTRKEPAAPGGEPKDCDFQSSRDLLDFTTVQLLWSWYRRDRDSGDRKGLRTDAPE
jgi:hypothetical protein